MFIQTDAKHFINRSLIFRVEFHPNPLVPLIVATHTDPTTQKTIKSNVEKGTPGEDQLWQLVREPGWINTIANSTFINLRKADAITFADLELDGKIIGERVTIWHGTHQQDGGLRETVEKIRAAVEIGWESPQT